MWYSAVMVVLRVLSLPGDLVQSAGWFLEYHADPRTKDWLLMSSFRQIYTILIIYIVFCLHLGPWLMRDRKPFELKTFLIVYNAANVGISLYFVYQALVNGWGADDTYTCQPVDYSNRPQAIRLAELTWYYFMVKVFELTDTVLFVIRKKTNQISFLHMVHHTIMPLAAFVGTRYLPGGHGTLIGLLNSMVHVIMYSYYLLAALGPAYKKYLWWKKYITIMQMTQFGIIFVHMSLAFFNECKYPKIISFLVCIWSVLFFKMFFNFYVTTYVRRPKKAS